MASYVNEIKPPASGYSLRLDTLLKIRWVAILGQTVAVLVVWLYLGFDFNPQFCLALIGTSVLLNIVLGFRYPANQRMPAPWSTLLLSYDILQLSMLLFLTGGLQNPFSILMLVPVVIAATTLSINDTFWLGALGVICASLLAFFYFPLPWRPDVILQLPTIYIAGMWLAIVSSLTFTSAYAFRVADESRKLADALAATELVLQREQHLSSLDGLAAAAAHELGTPLATIALVSKEMSREFDEDSSLFEDAQLLRSQAERCREILQTLTSLSSEGDRHIGVMPFSAFMEDIAAPHRNFGVKVEINLPDWAGEPDCVRNPAILYGLGNLVENAVDYAREKVVLTPSWDDAHVQVTINDDGRGFGEELIPRIGEPYVKDRTRGDSGGLGLGLFIAKTLLERSGAVLKFENRPKRGLSGAHVTVVWPRQAIEARNEQETDA